MRQVCATLILSLFSLGSPSAYAQKKAEVVLSPEAERAVEAGLAFLAREQAEDGSWGAGLFKGNAGITGLCGLAYLAGGHTPGKGDLGKKVQAATQYLLDNEKRDTPGYIQPLAGAGHGPMYGHGFATLFLAEAAMVMQEGKPKGQTLEFLKRSVDLLVRCQNKEGGWRYQPTSWDTDISVTCCVFHALTAAQRAGIAVPKDTLSKAAAYALSCQDKESGGFRYQRAGAPGTTGTARSAAALSILLAQKNDADFKKGLRWLRRSKPDAGDFHYFYERYYRALLEWRLDEQRKEFFAALQKELLSGEGVGKLRKDHWGDFRNDVHYCTAMALIVLQMPREKLALIRGG